MKERKRKGKLGNANNAREKTGCTTAAASFAKQTHKTNLPMVGMVVTISPSLSLYRIVVLPAASRPTLENKREEKEKN